MLQFGQSITKRDVSAQRPLLRSEVCLRSSSWTLAVSESVCVLPFAQASRSQPRRRCRPTIRRQGRSRMGPCHLNFVTVTTFGIWECAVWANFIKYVKKQHLWVNKHVSTRRALWILVEPVTWMKNVVCRYHLLGWYQNGLNLKK